MESDDLKLILGVLRYLSHDSSAKEDLIKSVPSLIEVSDEIVEESVDSKTGNIKPSFIRAVAILKSNIEVLQPWLKGRENLVEAHYHLHRREVYLAKVNITPGNHIINSGATQPNLSNAESVQESHKFPPILKQLRTFSKASVGFVKSGLRTTPPELLAAREATCRACPEWDSEALKGTGRCKKCGCSTWAKLRMATERCPLGKWEPVSDTQPKQDSAPEQEPTNK